MIALNSVAALAVSACSGENETPAGPGAVSEGEARALDEAAKMLDAQRLPEGALPDVEQPKIEPSNADAPSDPRSTTGN
ncbi:MAG: hypothetical protein AAF559_03720 [Pseudomonadota bacterium]